MRTAVVFQRKGYNTVRFIQPCPPSIAIRRPFTSSPVTFAAVPRPARIPTFAKLAAEDIKFFESVLGTTGVLTSKDDIEGYNTDWMNKYHGQAQTVLKPISTQQVSEILKYCNQRRLAVCPQGGNTGLVGGSVPVHDEIVLNLSKMTQIISFEETSGIVVAQAGVVLEALDQYLGQKGYITPLDLGAKGSCQIGGNAATNAGGIRLLRFGSLKGNILGLEVVLPDGTILDTLTTLRKDNTGYDLKQLFVGSEGTLGVITALSILCPPRSSSVNVALLGVPSFDAALSLLRAAKKDLGEILSAYEFFDSKSFEFMLSSFPQQAFDPLSQRVPIYILIETMGSNADHDKAKLDAFLESVMGEGLVLDGTIAQDALQQQRIWFLRENLAPACAKAGYCYKYDLSLPVPRMYDLVGLLQERFVNYPEVQVTGYGHLGDGNLHLNIISPKGHDDRYLEIIEPFVYEFTAAHRGSVSAEHGIGLMKPGALHFSKTPAMIDLMRLIKKTLDPNGILNPYKVLPDTEEH